MQQFTSLEYLKIDVASNFGLDKALWEERIQWFDENQPKLEDLLVTIESGQSTKGTLLAQAKEPALFYAGLKAWSKAVRGEAIGYPISLDATASGAQILAILIGCSQSASLCNVTNTGQRKDLYTEAYNMMLELIGDSSKITRDQLKDAIMPSFYGSKARPKEIFGDKTPLYYAFEKVMQEGLPGIWGLNKALLDLWQPDALAHSWVLPDNFHVRVKVMDLNKEYVQFLNKPYEVITKINRPMTEGRSISANVVHSIDGMVVREMMRRCSYDPNRLEMLLDLLTNDRPLYSSRSNRPQDILLTQLLDHYAKTGFFSARVLELLDEENLWMVDPEPIKALISTLPEKPFHVLSVHDCFRVHPNYGNDLRQQYVQILYELATSNVLSSIVSQITGEDYAVIKFEDISGQVRQAEYALS